MTENQEIMYCMCKERKRERIARYVYELIKAINKKANAERGLVHDHSCP